MSEFVGMEKLSLVDFDSKIVCTLFSSGCNFNCAFCHNSPLIEEVKDNCIKFEEIIAYLKSRKNMLDGVCITGGEPTLMDDLKEKIIQIKELGLLVKLDTNGTNPRILKELIEEKLIDYVAMDIKNSKERYNETIGIDNFDISLMEKSVEILRDSDVDFEFRTTVTKNFHTMEDIEKIGEWIKGTEKYYLQNFVDSGNLIDSNVEGVSKEEMQLMLERIKKYVPTAEIRGL
jgi:pyruvate formate lyase activating enzyme